MSVCSHPKIKLEGVPYEVDSGISGLIQKITDRGIRTFDSCEDSFNGGRIFIYFNSGIDIQSFMDVLFASGVDESDQLYMRIKSNTDEGPDAWQYITGVHPIVAKPWLLRIIKLLPIPWFMNTVILMNPPVIVPEQGVLRQITSLCLSFQPSGIRCQPC
jgi:hypothetical protein